jgi:hypothetical protein
VYEGWAKIEEKLQAWMFIQNLFLGHAGARPAQHVTDRAGVRSAEIG